MNTTATIQQQNELFLLLIIHFAEFAGIGIFGGTISYLLDYYIRSSKNQESKFDVNLLILNGILGGFAAFIVITVTPLSSLEALIGVSALAGLSSIPLLSALKSFGVDYFIQKIFKKDIEDSANKQNQNNSSQPDLK